MYSSKFPIELIKKKVKENTIAYKFKWNNGTISIEPMNQLTPQMLELVHNYELQQHYQSIKKIKLNQFDSQTQIESNFPSTPQKVNNLISTQQDQEGAKLTHKAPIKSFKESNLQSNTILPQDIIPQTQQSTPKQYLKKTFIKQPHQPRHNKDCIIKSIRRDNADIFLLVTDDYTKWVKIEDLKKDSPVTLCDYLLSKVRFK